MTTRRIAFISWTRVGCSTSITSTKGGCLFVGSRSSVKTPRHVRNEVHQRLFASTHMNNYSKKRLLADLSVVRSFSSSTIGDDAASKTQDKNQVIWYWCYSFLSFNLASPFYHCALSSHCRKLFLMLNLEILRQQRYYWMKCTPMLHPSTGPQQWTRPTHVNCAKHRMYDATLN